MGRSTAARLAPPLATVVVVVVVLAAVVLAGLVAPPAPAGAADACGGTTPGGQVRVAIAVDDGVEPPSVRCFALPEGATGADLLRERADALGVPRPRYAPSGLLCAIDGFPAPPACGELVGGTYHYWAYFQGTTGTWAYGASVNPFTRRLRDGDIEGWRFTTKGTANGSSETPRVAPDRGALFPAAPAPTTPPAPAPAPVPVPGGGTAAPSSPAAIAGAAAGGDPTPPSSAPGPDGGGGDGATGGVTASTTTASPGGDVAGDDEQAGSAAIDAEPASSSTDLAGPVVGVVAVALVAGAAALRFRAGARSS